MIYILLVLSCVTGYASGCFISTIEFNSKETCEAAQTAVKQQLGGNKSVCVLK